MTIDSTLIGKIKNVSQKSATKLIAIDGFGGAGKSTFAKKLVEELPGAKILQLDDFYAPGLGAADRKRLLEEVLIPLSKNETAKYREYLWATDTYSDWKEIEPGGILIVEGVFSLHSELFPYYDFTIWIEFPQEKGFTRAVKRDLDAHNVDNTKLWQDIWMPLEKEYKETEKPFERASIILQGE